MELSLEWQGFVTVSNCSFFLLLPSSVSPHYRKREEKMSEWSRRIFPQSLSPSDILHCGPVPSVSILLSDRWTALHEKRIGCLS